MEEMDVLKSGSLIPEQNYENTQTEPPKLIGNSGFKVRMGLSWMWSAEGLPSGVITWRHGHSTRELKTSVRSPMDR